MTGNTFLRIFVEKHRAQPGFEPGTTCTLSEYHTPRPLSLDYCYIHLINLRFIMQLDNLNLYALRRVLKVEKLFHVNRK